MCVPKHEHTISLAAFLRLYHQDFKLGCIFAKAPSACYKPLEPENVADVAVCAVENCTLLKQKNKLFLLLLVSFSYLPLLLLLLLL